MRVFLLALGIGLLYWLAAVFDSGAAPRMIIVSGRFEALLALAAGLSIATRPAAGAFWGFLAGVIAGGMSGANMAHYCISYTTACFLASYAARLPLEQKGGIALLELTGTILVAKIIYMFLAAPPNVGSYLASASISAILSSFIGLAVYALARRIFQSKEV